MGQVLHGGAPCHPHGADRHRHPVHQPRPDECAFRHIFDRVCDDNAIEHRLTKVRHPWTSGQVERMNRTIKDATVKPFHYDDHARNREGISRTSSTPASEDD